MRLEKLWDLRSQLYNKGIKQKLPRKKKKTQNTKNKLIDTYRYYRSPKTDEYSENNWGN